ncbi:unnamed protein product [Lactuca saligna]|uniref:Uncharacterized protein n=1 Tax=Lactuca saligna TaxID=75948 RepID=A0AA36ENU9_LACSI|nr:unnamed protein product [Lactuca saligna]
MVSKNSIYYGNFDGFQSPMAPKAPRSLRRNSHRKSSEGSKICAFDLLASIADKLLQESESSTSITSPEQKDQITLHKESPHSDNDSGLEHVSDVKTNVKLEPCEAKNVDKMEGDLCNFNLFNSIAEIQTEGVNVKKQSEDFTASDPMESCVNTRVLTKSYTSLNLPSKRVNVKMGIRDDTKLRAFREKSHARYRRIRKMMAYRYQKVTLKKNYLLPNTTISETKPNKNREKIYSKDRCQTEAPSKRRKLFHEKSGNGDSHVKFSIKSFKIPELYIEIPETATVGSLKRTVMEAVSAILGGELHVGVLLKGKKVKDNNRTLQQTGISRDSDLKSLGFTLEPNLFQAIIPSPLEKEAPFQDKDQEMIATSAANSSLDYHVDENQEFVPLQTELLKEGMSLVQVTKKCEASQRRIRRPFSVSEVEALVEAVETLGTGRWRDIKLRAFDDANHRTYVDLKDKWKTLVHTAGISPQQRRGEPVPQGLLDRVQAAHSYWSQNQRKHQTKPVQILAGSSVESVGNL